MSGSLVRETLYIILGSCPRRVAKRLTLLKGHRPIGASAVLVPMNHTPNQNSRSMDWVFRFLTFPSTSSSFKNARGIGPGYTAAVRQEEKSRELMHSMMTILNNTKMNTGNMPGEQISGALITHSKGNCVKGDVH